MPGNKTVIYHNPRCSKSRKALEILRQEQCDPEVVHYLDSPPDQTELKRIVELLGLSARDLLRTTEAVYQEKNLDRNTLTDDQIIAIIVSNPVLMQRPVVVRGNQAIIGRPPEKVLEILA